MAQDTILGTDVASTALLTKINNDFAECFTSIAEVVAARTSTVTAETHASLDARLESIESDISAVAAGSGVIVSLNDTTVGVLNGKLVVSDGITLTERNDGGNESLELKTTFASATEATTGTNAVKSISPSTLTDVLVSHFLI